MGFLDRLFGRADPEPEPPRRPARPGGPEEENRQAIERYRYLLRTAPPEAVEQAHTEAFSRLTPEQRRLVLDELGRDLPPAERAASDDPASLARMATRAELRRPGTLERSFERMPAMGGVGFFGGTFLSTLAGVFVANALFDAFLGDGGGGEGGGENADGGEGGDAGADAGLGDVGADAGGDFGGFGDFGGDFGGGFEG